MANPRRHHYVPQWLSKRWEQVNGKLLGGRSFDNQPVKGFRTTRYAIGWTRYTSIPILTVVGTHRWKRISIAGSITTLVPLHLIFWTF